MTVGKRERRGRRNAVRYAPTPATARTRGAYSSEGSPPSKILRYAQDDVGAWYAPASRPTPFPISSNATVVYPRMSVTSRGGRW